MAWKNNAQWNWQELYMNNNIMYILSYIESDRIEQRSSIFKIYVIYFSRIYYKDIVNVPKLYNKQDIGCCLWICIYVNEFVKILFKWLNDMVNNHIEVYVHFMIRL